MFSATGSCCSTFHPHKVSPRYRSVQHPDEKKITHQKERCTPVEPPRNKSERGCGSHLHTNGSLSKVKEQMIGALCLGAVLQKDWADVLEVWHWLGKAVNGHTNGLVFLSLLTLQLRSFSMSETQRSRVNQTHCAHGKRNRKHLDSQCALNVDEAALYMAALGGWQQAKCGRHILHCLPIA